ncbi:MAG: hypothetical protein JNL67_16100 [Planctomycetaceae bacterium]|nr:hypothetical protein [Planctomycetaceae bacterium]
MRSKPAINSILRNYLLVGIVLAGSFGWQCANAQNPSSQEIVIPAAQAPVKPVSDVPNLVQRICFGSCANQNEPQPILRVIVKRQPDLFIYLGDNI